MRLGTKLAALAVAASSAGLLGYTGLSVGANATTTCGSAQQPAVQSAGPVYTSGTPSAGSSQSGYVGAAGSQGGAGGYVQASGSASSSGVTGNVTASGTSPAQSGTAAVGNDGNESNTIAGPVAYCQG